MVNISKAHTIACRYFGHFIGNKQMYDYLSDERMKKPYFIQIVTKQTDTRSVNEQERKKGKAMNEWNRNTHHLIIQTSGRICCAFLI